jgi:hypothetical protein
MKKLIIILAIAATFLVSCQKDDNQVVPPPDPIKTSAS